MLTIIMLLEFYQLFVHKFSNTVENISFIFFSILLVIQYNVFSKIGKERKRAKLILDNLSETLIYQYVIENGIGGYTYLSNAIQNLSNFLPNDILNNPELLCQIINKEDVPTIQMAEAKSLETLSVFDVEFRINVDSIEKWLHVHSLPYKKDNKIIFDGYMTDITDKKVTEESLRSEKQLLRTVIDNIPDSVYVKDIDGRKILINVANLMNTHYKSENDILGKTDFDLFPLELANKFNIDDQSVFKTGLPVLNREEFLITNDGTKKWQLTSKIPIFDSTGNVNGLVGIGRDITKIKESEEKLKEAMNIAKLGSWEYDVSSDQFTFNNQFYSIYGTRVEKEGIFMSSEMYTQKFVHPDDMEIVSTEIKNAMDTNNPDYQVVLEHRIRRVNNEIGYISVYIRIKKDDLGNTVKIYGVNQDITDRKSIELELTRKNSYLEYASKIIRHDMYSGINMYLPRGINGLKRKLNEEVINTLRLGPSLNLMKGGLSHLQKVYKGVYEFTNLIKQNAELHTSLNSLDTILINFINNTSYKDQVIIDKLPMKDVNPDLFCIAIDNLIRNGLKYNDSEIKMVHIYQLDDDNIIIEDNGRGLTQTEYLKLLKNEGRKDNQKETGSGLGLSICKAILDEHKFIINYEDTMFGTKIKIKLK